MKKLATIVLAGLFLVHTGGAPAWATVNSLTIPSPTQDSYIREDNTTRNYGASSSIWVQSRNGARNYRSLVQFDLGSVPAGATIEAAQLRLNIITLPANQRTVNVHRLTNSWLEGSGTGQNNSPAINGVTWWERQYGNNWWTGAGPWDWQVRGGDFQAAATAGAVTPAARGWMSWDVVADVSAWYGGTANYGWLLKDAAENSGTRQRMEFVSKEDGVRPLQWPQLVVTYLMGDTQGPLEMFVGETTTATVSFINTGGLGGDQLSSASITIPAGFSDIPTLPGDYTIVATGGKNWQMTAGPSGPFGPQTLTFAAASPADEVAGGEQIDITFILRAPWLEGNTVWPSTIQGAAGGTFTPPDLNVMITGTSLNLVAGGDQSLADIFLAGSDQTSSGSLGILTARDGRGTAAGWQVFVAAADFVKLGDPSKTIPAAGFSVPAVPPVTTVSGTGPPVSNSGSLAGAGLQLLLADVGSGAGEFQVTPDLSLDVPAETYEGTYTSTVTETISSLP